MLNMSQKVRIFSLICGYRKISEVLLKSVDYSGIPEGIEWCMNYDCNTNYFFLRFFGRDPISGKKLTKLFLHRNVIIHTPFDSPCQI